MADVINRLTKEVLNSVNTPDYPAPEWLVISPAMKRTLPPNPNHWKIQGDTIIEASAAEKTASDAARLAPTKASAVRRATLIVDEFVLSRYPASTQNVFLYMLLHKKGGDLATIEETLDWIVSVYAHLDVVKGNIAAAVTLEAVNAVALDLTSFAASDPNARLSAVLLRR